ncbi:MAG: hypothetical protein U0271_01530 [Polyangiaceae bacterium]
MRAFRLMAMQGDGGGGWGQGGGGGSYPPGPPGGGAPPPGGLPPNIGGQTVVGPLQFVPDAQPNRPSGAVPPPPPPNKSRRGGGGKIGIIVGAVVLVVVGLVAGWFFFLRGAPKTPVALGELPSDTQVLQRLDVVVAARPDGLEIGDVPDEARWAMFAERFCGAETNVYRGLINGYEDYAVEGLANALAEKEDLKKALSCGREVADNIGKRGAVYTVAFKDGKESRSVDMFNFDRKDLPETTKKMKSVKEADNVEQTYCIKKPKDESDDKEKDKEKDSDDDRHDKDSKKGKKYEDCTPTALGKIQKKNVWLAGSMDDIAKFGQEYSPEGKNKLEEMDLFEKVLGRMDGHFIRVGIAEAARGSVPFVKDDDVQEKTKKAMKAVKLSGTSITLDGPWEKQITEYHCDGEEDAKDLESALRSHYRAAARESKDAIRESKEREDEADKKDSSSKSKSQEKIEKVKKKWVKAKSEVEIRAMQEVEIEISGKQVTVKVTEKPTGDEKDAWKEWRDLMKERSDKAAAIVRQLEKGERPNGGDLKALSEKLAEALDPPEWKTLDDIGGIRVPGAGMCRPGYGEANKQTCAYKKLTKDEVLSKIKEAAESDGFTYKKQEYSDSFFDITKGSTKIEMFVFDGSKGETLVSLELKKDKSD